MENRRPMLALPMGAKDYEAGGRLAFLKSCQPVLEDLGWTIGIEAKGLDLGWAHDCFCQIQDLGGRITYHPPDVFSGRGNPGKTGEETLTEIAEQVRHYHDEGLLELASIHLMPAISEDQPANFDVSRYNAPIDAFEMLEHIQNHLQFLGELNAAMGGILAIENVPLTNFCQAGYRLPTRLTLRAGTWWDLVWLKEQTGVQVTFDLEHFLSAKNLLRGLRDLSNLPRYDYPMESDEEALAAITGYRLIKGFPPQNTRQYIGLSEYIHDSQPVLYHLGGAVQDVVYIKNRSFIATHRPIGDCQWSEDQGTDLRLILSAICGSNAIGAVIEVCGKLMPHKYDPWSPRPKSDEVAKKQSFLSVLDAIARSAK